MDLTPPENWGTGCRDDRLASLDLAEFLQARARFDGGPPSGSRPAMHAWGETPAAWMTPVTGPIGAIDCHGSRQGALVKPAYITQNKSGLRGAVDTRVRRLHFT